MPSAARAVDEFVVTQSPRVDACAARNDVAVACGAFHHELEVVVSLRHLLARPGARDCVRQGENADFLSGPCRRSLANLYSIE